MRQVSRVAETRSRSIPEGRADAPSADHHQVIGEDNAVPVARCGNGTYRDDPGSGTELTQARRTPVTSGCPFYQVTTSYGGFAQVSRMPVQNPAYRPGLAITWPLTPLPPWRSGSIKRVKNHPNVRIGTTSY
jgi:hypothetical protein